MRVTRRQIIARGLGGNCPNCGAHTLFPPGWHFTINPQCSNCGLKFDRADGFFLGPFVVNYAVTVFIFVIPVILLCVAGLLGVVAAIAVAGTVALLLPLLLYRRSWSWWLMIYFWILPQKLPGNRNELREDEEE